MDKAQIRTMGLFGYAVEELPGKPLPKMTYYKIERGEVVAMPGLPADPHNMERYLKRGFTLTLPKMRSELPQPLPEGEPVGFTCETCGKVLSTRLALVGHSRSHKPKLEV